jgi:O-antigen ligase
VSLRGQRTLDRLTPFVVGATVLAAAAGISIQRELFHAGRPARWLFLALFVAFAAVAVVAGPRGGLRRLVVVALGLFCALSLVSVGWSANPDATIGRAGAQLLVVGAALALSARPGARRAALRGVLGAVAVVAVGSALYWLVSPGGAVQPASIEYPGRFRGLEQNPNTIAMLLALGLPLALAQTLGARTRRERAGLVALLLLLLVELVASGSRGGLLAALGGLVVVALLSPLAGRLRLATAAAVLAALCIGAWISTLATALPASSAPPVAAVRHVGVDAETVLPLMAEVGNPWWEHHAVSTKRQFFDTSVRMRALEGSISRGLERPLLGWGYGAEIEAFLSRYYGFDSQNPENGYIGIFLQLGLIGIAVFLATLAVCAAAAIRSARRFGSYARVGAAGGGAAGILLGLSQSFFHGPGGIAFVAFWTCLLVAAAPADEPGTLAP